MPQISLTILQTLFHRLDRLILYFIIRPLGLLRPRSTSKDPSAAKQDVVSSRSIMRPLHELQRDVLTSFSQPCSIEKMKYMSECLRKQYVEKLQCDTASMLPSFCTTLPSGQERGTFIALDLGGSTFRVALVELSTRSSENGGMKIAHMTVNKIDEQIRQYCAHDFFAWMADKIQGMLNECDGDLQLDQGFIPIGVAWSFPVEQTSHQGGTVLPMGKGFKAHEGIVGQDLGSFIERACRDRGLEVRVNAVINDSSSTLLARAYKDPTTRMGLILGTGTNAAVFLPVKSLGADKFGSRNPAWFKRAERVIVNTEASMFGKCILPETRWDEELNRSHLLPDFQPLEYKTTGRYLGEIFRLVVVEAVDTCNLFDGVLPEPIREGYTVDTALLAAIEEDTSTGLADSAKKTQKYLGLSTTPSPHEMTFLKSVAQAISRRATSYMATTIHALWSLESAEELEQCSKSSVAANGSVIQKYPGFRSRCEAQVAELIECEVREGKRQHSHKVTIDPTDEATILGVAVAVAIADKT